MDIIGVLEKIGFDGRVFLFNLINFLIVAFLVKKFFFSKVMKVIEERKAVIEEGIVNAEKAKEELEKASESKQEIINQAKLEANQLIQNASETAKITAQNIKHEAELEAAKIREQAKEKARLEKEQMMEEFRNEASELVVLATQKMLAESPDFDKSKEPKKMANEIVVVTHK